MQSVVPMAFNALSHTSLPFRSSGKLASSSSRVAETEAEAIARPRGWLYLSARARALSLGKLSRMSSADIGALNCPNF